MERNSFENMGEIFDSFFGGTVTKSNAKTKSVKGGWLIQYPVPGYIKDFINIEATSKTVKIKGTIPENTETDYHEFIKPFNLAYSAPENNSFKGVDVKIEHGILNVFIKSEQENKIEVNYN
jgi:HSP20 family molecular chaperone IbpA